jgi:hypothetical protein
MFIDSQLLSVIANVATAVGIWFLWKQVNLLKSQICSDHERSRREKAVDLCLEWSKFLKENTIISRSLVENFSIDQAQQLWRFDPLIIKSTNKPVIDACFSYQNGFYEEKDGNIIISRRGSSFLRWHIIGYLNMLESILSARRHSIADRDIIKEEFKYLLEPTKGRIQILT